MKKLFLFSLWLLAAALGVAQTVSGVITDKSTGETLIGATITDARTKKGTVTNVYGQYSLSLKGDSATLRISFIGYKPQTLTVALHPSPTVDVALVPNIELAEVVITAEKAQSVKVSQMSAIEVPVEQLRAVPVLFGEADVLKALQLMPGVQSGSEGTNGMYVRGGGPDENLYLLDGVSLYNVSHAGGFFSAFNSDAIKNVTLYKGSFPAHFGGRLSSVVDITTNNGHDNEYHGNASVGLISAKLALEGPIVKHKTTLSLSARRTYADLLFLPIAMAIVNPDDEDMKAGYFFYDVNAKITHAFSNKSRLFATFYIGDDDMTGRLATSNEAFGNGYIDMDMAWGNTVASLRWNRQLTPQLFMNLSGSYTRYRNSIGLTLGEKQEMLWGTTASEFNMDYRSGIQDFNLRADFDYNPSPEHFVKFGINATHHQFSPEVLKNDGSVDTIEIHTTSSQDVVYANEYYAFVEDDWEVNEQLKINGGLNLSAFGVGSAFYPSLQPRLSARWMIVDDLSFKLGYAYTTQYMHLLCNSSYSMPTDLWVPVTEKIKPMNANQVAAGLFYSWSGRADFSVEGYYKTMDNIVEYRDGATFWGSSEGWEEQVFMGEGRSYGVEFLVQRNIGNITGWIGYTWSHTDHRFNRPGQELSDGNWFPAKYDRRHDVSIVLSYRPSDTWDVSATWIYSTGTAVTLGRQQYEGLDGQTLSFIENRNNFRLPDYHRLDLSVNFYRSFTHCSRIINVSVYNVYNHQNPYLIYHRMDQPYKGYGTSLMQLSLFPIIPSASYTLKF